MHVGTLVVTTTAHWRESTLPDQLTSHEESPTQVLSPELPHESTTADCCAVDHFHAACRSVDSVEQQSTQRDRLRRLHDRSNTQLGFTLFKRNQSRGYGTATQAIRKTEAGICHRGCVTGVQADGSVRVSREGCHGIVLQQSAPAERNTITSVQLKSSQSCYRKPSLSAKQTRITPRCLPRKRDLPLSFHHGQNTRGQVSNQKKEVCW